MAECVTTAEDAAILQREGVGFLQGYYFGRPSLERPWLAPAIPAPVDFIGDNGLAAVKLAANAN